MMNAKLGFDTTQCEASNLRSDHVSGRIEIDVNPANIKNGRHRKNWTLQQRCGRMRWLKLPRLCLSLRRSKSRMQERVGEA
jgi:hypothetical protein